MEEQNSTEIVPVNRESFETLHMNGETLLEKFQHQTSTSKIERLKQNLFNTQISLERRKHQNQKLSEINEALKTKLKTAEKNNLKNEKIQKFALRKSDENKELKQEIKSLKSQIEHLKDLLSTPNPHLRDAKDVQYLHKIAEDVQIAREVTPPQSRHRQALLSPIYTNFSLPTP